jgi:hypothetical protein
MEFLVPRPRGSKSLYHVLIITPLGRVGGVGRNLKGRGVGSKVGRAAVRMARALVANQASTRRIKAVVHAMMS